MENKIEIYQTSDNQTQIEVRFEEDTVWLTQQQVEYLKTSMTDESNNTSSIISKVWSFCNTLMDDGVGYGDYVEQLTTQPFLNRWYNLSGIIMISLVIVSFAHI